MKSEGIKAIVPVSIFTTLLLLVPSIAGAAAAMPEPVVQTAWWIWVILLFVFCFFLGIVAVIAGVGGGVLFVPIVSSFFPFHIDFV
ncbi:MAG: sulfite exporter TauE/SafE family protein, partial [Chlorobium sp.]